MARDEPGSDDLVTVAVLSSLPAAWALRGALVAAGLEAVVVEQDAVRFDGFRSAPNRGVRVQVREGDLEEAKALVAVLGEGGDRA